MGVIKQIILHGGSGGEEIQIPNALKKDISSLFKPKKYMLWKLNLDLKASLRQNGRF